MTRISERAWGWLAPAAVAVLALVLRLWNLGRPNAVMFDETYYAKDAWSLLHFGYVQDFTEQANDEIVAGRTGIERLVTGEPTWIVHPDAGKWFIALGEQLFGMNAFGWRVSAVVAGALTVFVLARLVRRLTGSTWIGVLAGLLLTLDGTHFVMSRIALLDVFLTLWLVCAVAALAADRDWLARRLRTRPGLALVRPWQLAAGISFGLACGTKWSGLYVLAALGLAIVAWEFALRRSLGQRLSVARFLTWSSSAFVSLVVVAFLVYLVTWTGFLVHHEVYVERFGNGYGDIERWEQRGPFGALWNFHVMTLDFHTGEYLAGKTHPYASHPLGWLVQWRPVSVHTATDVAAEQCGAPATSTCISEVLILGNPAIWWVGALAVVAAIVAFVRRPSWRWSVPLLGVAATWLPWFASTDRPIFSFYAVATVPFLIVAICLLVAGAERRRPRAARLAAGAFVALVIALFWWFHPVWTDALMPYDDWRARLWFARWI